MERLYKLAEVAKRLGVHRNTLLRWVATGCGPKVGRLPGGFYVFKERDVAEWEESLKSQLTRP